MEKDNALRLVLDRMVEEIFRGQQPGQVTYLDPIKDQAEAEIKKLFNPMGGEEIEKILQETIWTTSGEYGKIGNSVRNLSIKNAVKALSNKISGGEK